MNVTEQLQEAFGHLAYVSTSDDESRAHLNAAASCVRDALAAYRTQPAQASQPLFWVRLCSDGSYEGPIHDSAIEPVRKASGAWTPLYISPQPARAPLTVEQIRSIWVEHGCDGEDAESFARAIEAAHGITGTEGGNGL